MNFLHITWNLCLHLHEVELLSVRIRATSDRMLSSVTYVVAVIRPSNANVCLAKTERQTDTSRPERRLGLWIQCFSRDVLTHPLGLACMSNCRCLPPCPTDVMNDRCDKVRSVCISHEILSNAFRVLCIGYACIWMDSVVLFAKLCTVLLSNVSPPAMLVWFWSVTLTSNPSPHFYHHSITLPSASPPHPLLNVRRRSC